MKPTRTGGMMLTFTVICDDPGAWDRETSQTKVDTSWCLVTQFLDTAGDDDMLYKGDQVVVEGTVRQWKGSDDKSRTGFQAREVRVTRRSRQGRQYVQQAPPQDAYAGRDPWSPGQEPPF
jgi:single-stranded DNA-binding protein